MGVCKCKQRNVTNQFCYICRMNVCESCIVKDHQRCIIKSYVQWLQDSDYNAICLLCMESVNQGEVIRLACYDLFHWDCFNKWALEHMEGTPASKYLCPDCKSPVFPPKQLVSPVADVIRAKFATVGWGRRCLGLAPDPSSQAKSQPKPKPTSKASTPTVEIRPIAESTPKPEYKSAESIAPPPPATTAPLNKPKKHLSPTELKQPQEELTPRKTSPLNTMVPNNQVTYTRDKFPTEVAAATTPHKVIDSRRYADSKTRRMDDAKINVTHDIDDNKYKRKGLTHWVGNLLNLNKDKKALGGKGLTFRRVTIALIIFTIIFLTILYGVSMYGRNFAASDPMLDPMKNPNIKVSDVDADGVLDGGGAAPVAAAAGIM